MSLDDLKQIKYIEAVLNNQFTFEDSPPILFYGAINVRALILMGKWQQFLVFKKHWLWKISQIQSFSKWVKTNINIHFALHDFIMLL